LSDRLNVTPFGNGDKTGNVCTNVILMRVRVTIVAVEKQ